MLGRGDSVVLQLIVDSASAAGTVTATYQTTNDPSQSVGGNGTWSDVSNLSPSVSLTSVSDVPKSAVEVNSSSDAMGAFGRVKVVAGASMTGVSVRVIACLRTAG